MVASRMAQGPVVKVASFNMSEQDVNHFMVKPWVVTSSDGSNGHPRKYASFAKKLTTYVLEQQVLSLETFIYGTLSFDKGIPLTTLIKMKIRISICIIYPK